MRKKAATQGWGKSASANNAKNARHHKHRLEMRTKKPKEQKGLSAHYTAKGGIEIGNFTGPGA